MTHEEQAQLERFLADNNRALKELQNKVAREYPVMTANDVTKALAESAVLAKAIKDIKRKLTK
jgi:hypothetical protein